MHKNLAFKDQHIEKEFKYSQSRIHENNLLILTMALLLQSSAIFFTNPLEMDVFESKILITFAIGMIGLISGYLIVRKKFSRHSDKAITLTVFLFIVGTAELINRIKQNLELSSWVYFFLGANIQSGCIFLLISQIRWSHSFFVFTASHIFAWFRVLDIINTNGALKTGLISLTTSIFIFFTLTYNCEKGLRISFQKISADTQQISAFDEILKKVMASAIIIMNNDNIVFINEATKKILDLKSKDEVHDILNRIEISHQTGIRQDCSINMIDEKITLRRNTLYWHYKNIEHQVQNSKDKSYSALSFQQALEGEIQISEETKSLSAYIAPIYWKGAKSTILILNDISSITNYFKTLDSYKDNLLATISHDLRTPLNGMMAMLELLNEETEGNSQKQKLQTIISSTKLLFNMINDILDFSLISKGRLRLRFEKTNIKMLVEETAKIVSQQAELKGLSLKFENLLPGNADYLVDGDRLRQVLLNLIGNAIKFTQKGQVFVRVYEENIEGRIINKFPRNPSITLRKEEELDEIEEDFSNSLAKRIQRSSSFQFENRFNESCSMKLDRKRIIFEIEDTGIGIKQEDIGKLFKLFSRVTCGHDQNMNGIGLGLTISQSLVTLMNNNRIGAMIKAVSEYGKGSIFSFPIYIDNEPSEIFKEVRERSMKIPHYHEAKPQNLTRLNDISPKMDYIEIDFLNCEGKKIIMVVDDDPINLLVATTYLETLQGKFIIVKASDGKEALEKVKTLAQNNEFIDIFLMDCNMPQMDGYEASKRLKKLMIEKHIPWAPIVAVTANVATSYMELCYECGMDLFLSKPYSKKQLFKTLEDAASIKFI